MTIFLSYFNINKYDKTLIYLFIFCDNLIDIYHVNLMLIIIYWHRIKKILFYY